VWGAVPTGAQSPTGDSSKSPILALSHLPNGRPVRRHRRMRGGCGPKCQSRCAGGGDDGTARGRPAAPLRVSPCRQRVDAAEPPVVGVHRQRREVIGHQGPKTPPLPAGTDALANRQGRLAQGCLATRKAVGPRARVAWGGIPTSQDGKEMADEVPFFHDGADHHHQLTLSSGPMLCQSV